MGHPLHPPRPLPLIIIIAGAALLCLYALVDPATAWWMPKCPLYFLTGLQCPGCGSQRAIHALLHGDLSAAMGHNALLVVMLPLLSVGAFAELTRKRHPGLYRKVCHPAAVYGVVAAVAVWAVARNIFL